MYFRLLKFTEMGSSLGHYRKFSRRDGMDLWILEHCRYVRLMPVESYMCSV